MHGWTDQERQLARKFGVPVGINWTWWWRAHHVLNSDERCKLEAFTQWLRQPYAVDLARCCRIRIV